MPSEGGGIEASKGVVRLLGGFCVWEVMTILNCVFQSIRIARMNA